MITMKRKGFTLIELLGVIVVLAVIAIITTPVILGVIEKSKKGALQSSGYGLVEAGILYHAEYQNSQTVRFDIKDNQIRTKEENKIDYKGSIKDGTILINNQGEVTVCINDGKYAAYKNYKDNKIIVVDQKTCTVPENNYIVYLDNESTIKEMTNTEITSAITKLTERVNQLEEENKKLKEQNGDTEINSTITNSIVDLRNNLNTKANSSDFANLQTIVNNHTTSINNLNNSISGGYLNLRVKNSQIQFGCQKFEFVNGEVTVSLSNLIYGQYNSYIMMFQSNTIWADNGWHTVNYGWEYLKDENKMKLTGKLENGTAINGGAWVTYVIVGSN